MATACELAGVEPHVETDGISYLPTLLGEPQTSHEYLFWSYGEKKALRMGPWKVVRTASDRPLELYNLEQDIGEQQNLAEQQPELVAKMEMLINEAMNKPITTSERE
jgi:arylsulfatase A-like enzyme